MNYKTLLIVLFVSVLAVQTSAQEKQVDIAFFEERAVIDATYEQSYMTTNIEDEGDFWKDQIQYENDLQQWSPKAFDVYLKEKSLAYIYHARSCDDHCNHSEHYIRQATYYMNYYEYYFPRESSAMISEVRVETSGLEVKNF
ncbi:hypothetical protein [Flagellimonas sp. GZD32]|uniref:hypothetical protein n=1 Tax=Flagellimonas cixiensis TaxID=3228750 RepID=UPI0035C8E23C